MAKAKRRRRQKDRRATRAARSAALAVQEAQRGTEERLAKALAADPLTDIKSLKVSVSDVMAAGVATRPVRWVIARCEPMSEYRVMNALRDRRIMAYMPMHRFCRRLRGEKRDIERPLLVGYLFVALEARHGDYVLTTLDGVEGLLKADGLTASIDPWAIVQIAAMEADGCFDHTGPRKPSYTKDQMVRIISGWAIGHNARVTSADEGDLMVQFEGIFKGAPVPMSQDHMEAVEIDKAA